MRSFNDYHSKRIPFFLAYLLNANPMGANSRAAAAEDSATSQTRSLLISVSIIAAIATPTGAATASAKNTTKTACPKPHKFARGSLRSRSLKYSGWLNGETLKRITIWIERIPPK